jgi:hypothetical protein
MAAAGFTFLESKIQSAQNNDSRFWGETNIELTKNI